MSTDAMSAVRSSLSPAPYMPYQPFALMKAAVAGLCSRPPDGAIWTQIIDDERGSPPHKCTMLIQLVTMTAATIKELGKPTCTHLPSYQVSQKSQAIQNSPVLQACIMISRIHRYPSSQGSRACRALTLRHEGYPPVIRSTTCEGRTGGRPPYDADQSAI